MEKGIQTQAAESLAQFILFAVKHLQHPLPELAYYATGEADHWAMQSHLNICGVFAVAAEYPEIERSTGISQDDLRETALKLFRYALRTHMTGDFLTTNGKQWGCHWISVLGLERMTRALNLLEPYMTADDLSRLREIRLCESRWRLNSYPVVAGVEAETRCNKPESNMWNGGFLLRTAADYPDDPDCEAFRSKGIQFILNAICRESDLESDEIFSGKPRREWQVGGNFTQNWSLDHHGYMNVGYTIITLSNLAMLHYNFAFRRQSAETALYSHAEELWRVVKNFIFPDGRLMRIGGDTRARYTYCQAYLLPVLVFARDFLKDPDAERLAENYMELIFKEQSVNGDGSYFGKRLSGLRDQGYYYYMRLESDPPLALSQYLAWTPQSQGIAPASDTVCSWHDDFHNAFLIRGNGIIRSFVQDGAQGPTLLCMPERDSSLAEWQCSGFAEAILRKEKTRTLTHWIKAIPDGFIAAGSSITAETEPTGEGEGKYDALASYLAVAALPDGKSMIVLEFAEVLKDFTFLRIRTAALKIPNDVYNGHRRNYTSHGSSFTLRMQDKAQIIDTDSRDLVIDEKIMLHAVYGIGSWKIDHPEEPEIKLDTFRSMRSLYADTVCGHRTPDHQRLHKGAIAADTGYVISADTEGKWQSRVLKTEGMLRAVEVQAPDGRKWCFAANFGIADMEWEGISIPPGQAVLRCCGI